MSIPETGERRCVQRRSGETLGTLKIAMEPSGQWFSARVWDISIRGVGLLTNSSLEAGSLLSVQPCVAGKSLSVALTAEVRHAHRLATGGWLLGCRFSR